MHLLRGRNVNQLLPYALRHLASVGLPESSRAGDVLVSPGPVTTVYDRPTERVLFWPERDANPFFHLFESLWILAGRNDIGFLTPFVKRMASFSDDGEHLHGAYGHRLRRHFSIGEHRTTDQLKAAIETLSRNPKDRRVVLQLWDAEEDLGRDGKDLPCNQQIFLRVGYGRAGEPNMLHMMTTSRSHDAIWGALGANAVHFSVIHEYLAARLGLMVGVYTQVSWNYHAYADVYERTRVGELKHWLPGWDTCPYARGEVSSYPLVTEGNIWDEENANFLATPEANHQYRNSFFPEVAKPLWLAHGAYKAGFLKEAAAFAELCQASDWRRAALEWLNRRDSAKGTER